MIGKNSLRVYTLYDCVNVALKGDKQVICKHCEQEIFDNGILWVEKGKVFPQYCDEKIVGNRITLHEPKEESNV